MASRWSPQIGGLTSFNIILIHKNNNSHKLILTEFYKELNILI